MPQLAHARDDDRPIAAGFGIGDVAFFARAANDNAPFGNQTFYLDGRVVLARAPNPGTGVWPATNTSYDALGRRQTLTFRDGSTQTWGYDNADRVTSIAHVFPNDTGNNVTFTYGYDPVGREMSKSVDNAAYDYVPPAANVTYAAANALNQYPSVGGYAYSYWPEGGLKETDTLAANYDELGTMIEGFTTLTPGVIDPAYGEYVGVDALGHKYFHEAQTVAGQPYPFVYHSTDGLRPETILEWVYQGLNGAPQTLQGTRRYVLGPDPDERWAYIGPNGGTYNPHTDREGTLIALSNGGLVSRIFTWDPYGQNTSPADETSTGPAGYLYRYTGQRFDPATSLYDYKARDYSPTLGRFYQPDPAGLDQGPNLYEYVGDEPTDDYDPTGMSPWQYYSHLADAALDASIEAHVATLASTNHAEFGTKILRTSDGRFVYGPLVQGPPPSESQAGVDLARAVGPVGLFFRTGQVVDLFSNPVATVHSRPFDDAPSGRDLINDDMNGTIGVVAGRSGAITAHIPTTADAGTGLKAGNYKISSGNAPGALRSVTVNSNGSVLLRVTGTVYF